MKKYEKLQEKYQREIVELKEFKARYEEAKVEADENFRKIRHLIVDANIVHDQDALDDAAASIRCDWADAYDELAEKVEREYWDVPFAKARKQGIERFYELAGL